MISRFAQIIFFLAFGLQIFISSVILVDVAFAAALVAGIAMIVNS